MKKLLLPLALLELGLLIGLWFLLRLVIRNAIAIFRDEP